MSSEYADLHLHTVHSDGTATVEELIKEVLTTDIRIIAITDHDNKAGIIPARQLGQKVGIEVIAGIELSCQYKGHDVHLLGYFFDPTNHELKEYCVRFRDERQKRSIKIIEKLKAHGVQITQHQVEALARGGAIGRPHIAQAVVDAGGASSYQQVFDRYINNDGPAYVEKFQITPQDAIALIHRAGGVAVLAHPGTIGDDSVVAHLVQHGLDGLEVYHPYHVTGGQVKHYHILASRYGLLISGGSDWHGARKPDIKIGQCKIHVAHVEKMREVAKSRIPH